ncbi:MAG: hypothetical protein WB797_14180 [Nocardioides sp.]
MRMNAVIGAVALTLAATTLAACGSGGSKSTGSYCTELKADKAYFESLSNNSSNVGDLEQVFSTVHHLAADAPSKVAADWKTLDTAITGIESALSDAGLKLSDLQAMENGQPPSGVDLSKLQALAPKLEALSNSDVSAAADRIAADAKTSCGVDLTGS